MDESEGKPQVNDAPESPESVTGAASAAAREAAENLKAGAQDTLNEIRGIRLSDFFTFDKLVFPRIATILFFLFCAVVVLSGLFGLLGGLLVLVSGQIAQGFLAMVMTVLGVVFTIVIARVWVEVVLVAFKINEGVQDIREMLHRKLG